MPANNGEWIDIDLRTSKRKTFFENSQKKKLISHNPNKKGLLKADQSKKRENKKVNRISDKYNIGLFYFLWLLQLLIDIKESSMSPSRTQLSLAAGNIHSSVPCPVSRNNKELRNCFGISFVFTSSGFGLNLGQISANTSFD